MSVPNPNSTERLFAKYASSFVRQQGRSAMHPPPSARRLSSATSSSGSTRSSGKSNSQLPVPPLKRTGSSSSDSEDEDFEAEMSRPLGPSREHSYSSSLSRLSRNGSATSVFSERQSDPLARAMEKKQKEDRMREREVRKVALVERELLARQGGVSLAEEEEEWKRLIREHGPSMGRRALSNGKLNTTHSWSYESLPPGIPLYNVDFDTSQTFVKTIRSKSASKLGELQEEVPSAPERKRLFIFASGQ